MPAGVYSISSKLLSIFLHFFGRTMDHQHLYDGVLTFDQQSKEKTSYSVLFLLFKYVQYTKFWTMQRIYSNRIMKYTYYTWTSKIKSVEIHCCCCRRWLLRWTRKRRRGRIRRSRRRRRKDRYTETFSYSNFVSLVGCVCFSKLSLTYIYR